MLWGSVGAACLLYGAGLGTGFGLYFFLFFFILFYKPVLSFGLFC